MDAVVPSQAVLDLLVRAAGDGARPGGPDARPIVGVDGIEPAPAAHLVGGLPGVGAPERHVHHLAVGRRRPDGLADGRDQRPESFLAFPEAPIDIAMSRRALGQHTRGLFRISVAVL